jgi:hypothetical protein
MNSLIVTVDLDWAPEVAIEETLDFLKGMNISPTIFSTHRSAIVEDNLNKLEVGLHPYFGKDSSHGASITDVVKHVMDLPHNLPAFRCHRFAVCNESKQAMLEAGMLLSSNICTDLEIVPPFRDRFGLIEAPIFLEDGSYLWREHPLEITEELRNVIIGPGIKVILIHPMHFAVNTPHFKYMYDIKQLVSRLEWNTMKKGTIDKIRWHGRGIRDFIIELLTIHTNTSTIGSLITAR